MKRYVRPRKDMRKSMFIALVGALLMIGIHILFWEIPQRMAVENQTVEQQEPQVQQEQKTSADLGLSEVEDMISAAKHLSSEIGEDYQPVKIINIIKRDPEVSVNPPVSVAPVPAGAGKVVIIIDDMGMNVELSEQALNLPGPITLAFLPYAPDLGDITGRARAQGHELMIHMPMEPMNPDLDVGPIALLDDMDDAALHENLDKAFASFAGYVGVNNHMGSRLTQNEHAMNVVMEELVKRGLLFVDSKTIATSVAGAAAATHGLNFAERDVFLDHEATEEFVSQALAHLEKIAKTKGVAIAIGHPKVATIEGLKKWIPTLKDKGLELVPISAAVHPPAKAAVQLSEEQRSSAPKNHSVQ